jgi:DNA repair photolyase
MSGVRGASGSIIVLCQLSAMRMGALRVTAVGKGVSGEAGMQKSLNSGEAQFDLLPSLPAYQPTRLPVLDERARGTKFIQLSVRSVLNTSASTHMGFWSINPYVGCEFGCTYCYARDTHRWVMERANRPTALPPEEAFEKEILIKSDVAEVLGRTLNPARLAGQSLVVGTATDPYQPAERRFRLTRRILEVLRSYQGLSIEIITKSPLVTRDLELLQELSRHNEVNVNISLATADPRLARRLELRSPVPAARLRALRRLTAAGVYAGLIVAPIIPGITDDWAGLARLMEAAKEAGARYVIGSALRLGPAARRRFLPVLEREFPALYERYRRHYAGSDMASRSYQDALTRRLNALRQAYGFAGDEGSNRRRRRLEQASRPLPASVDEQPALL